MVGPANLEMTNWELSFICIRYVLHATGNYKIQGTEYNLHVLNYREQNTSKISINLFARSSSNKIQQAECAYDLNRADELT